MESYKDVTIKADIIEEITRIYGYDNFAIHTTRSPLYPVRTGELKSNEDKIKDILVQRYNLHEVHSYVWAYNDELKALGVEVENNVKLANATNPNIETIRNSIIPTQLCQVKSNTSYSNDFGIFEIGRVVKGLDENNLCIEQKKLAITLFSKVKDIKTLYFELRDMLVVLSEDIKHKSLGFKKAEPTHSYEHPVNLYTIMIDNEEIGTIGIVHPTVGKKLDKKASVVFAEVDMNAFTDAQTAPIVYDEPSKFPPIDYDISVVVPEKLFFEDLSKCWIGKGEGILKGTKIVDTYDTDTVHSITIRFEFSSAERTLSSAEVQTVMDEIIAELAKIGANLR